MIPLLTQAMPPNIAPLSGAPTTDPLAALRPLQLPEPVSWWPPAPGWWLLAVVGIVAATLLIRALLSRYRRNAYRRAALAELEQLQSLAGENACAYASALNTLLRRTALSHQHESSVARLTGRDWLSYLDSRVSSPIFVGDIGQQMLRAAYDPASTVDTAALGAACRRWLRTHR